MQHTALSLARCQLAQLMQHQQLVGAMSAALGMEDHCLLKCMRL